MGKPRRNAEELNAMGPLLDQLPTIQADPPHIAQLIERLAIEMPPPQPIPPVVETDVEWRLFLGLCAGAAVIVLLVYLSVVDDALSALPGWLMALGASGGLAGLVALTSMVYRRRVA